MDSPKEPGIAIELIRLITSHVEMANPGGKQEYNLRLIALGRVESGDGKTLDVQAAFDLMYGVEKPLFNFSCAFIARYTRQDDTGMAWKDFSSAMALAHIIPYLREYVSNVTNRLPAPVLMLNPINTHALIGDYEERMRQAGTAKVAQPQREPA